jgi:hypothetical protein
VADSHLAFRARQTPIGNALVTLPLAQIGIMKATNQEHRSTNIEKQALRLPRYEHLSCGEPPDNFSFESWPLFRFPFGSSNEFLPS